MKAALHTLTMSLLLLPSLALAQQTTSATALPEWDKLSAAQRDALIAPMRERWNADPDARERMLAHAQRWQTMPVEQRRKAQRGMQRWEGMAGPNRDRARVLFEHIRSLTPEQREAFLKQWQAMTPEQRKEWVKARKPED